MFFVERSDLEWSEESGKQVALSHAVPDGAVVFLRLVPYLSTQQSHPVPYETEFVETNLEGRHEFRLHPVKPRNAERDPWIHCRHEGNWSPRGKYRNASDWRGQGN
jgi:hypothetical protein